MVKDGILLEQFERDLKRRERPDYFRNLKIFEEMFQEAIYFKVFPMKDPLEGIEVDIKIARVINAI